MQAESVLVIPELAFVSKSDLSFLDSFVSKGGVLVFSERISGESNIPSLQIPEGSFGNAFRSLNSSRALKTFFTPVSALGLEVDALNSLHMTIDGEWLKGTPYKEGAILFYGVQPLDSRSQSVTNTILHRLQGERLVINSSGTACSTALLIEPFGSKEILTAFADQMIASGMVVHWFLDPVSYARMIPTWENRFRKDGVVFLDDGTFENRWIANSLHKEFFSAGNSPKKIFFASQRKTPKGLSEGPQAELFPFQNLSIEKSADRKRQMNLAAQQWAAECQLGLSAPRVLSSGLSSEELKEWSAALKLFEKEKLLGLDLFGAQLNGSSGGAENTIREFSYRKDNPLKLQAGDNP